MVYYASQFTDRNELDLALAHRVKEEDDIIVGTKPELDVLSLSETVSVYGVPCAIRQE